MNLKKQESSLYIERDRLWYEVQAIFCDPISNINDANDYMKTHPGSSCFSYDREVVVLVDKDDRGVRL